MSNYFKYLIKQQKNLLIIYSVICFLLLLFPIIIGIPNSTHYSSTYIPIDDSATSIVTKFVYLMIPIMTVLPIISFRFILNKKTVDLFYTLPVNRKKLFRDYYYSAFFMAIIPPILMSCLGFVSVIMIYNENISLVLGYGLRFFIVAVICMSLYAIITFVVTKTNNIVDACVISFGYVILPILTIFAIQSFIEHQTFIYDLPLYDYVEIISNCISPLLLISRTIDDLFLRNSFISNTHWLYFGYSGITFLLFTYLARKSFELKKGEDADQISTNWMTYPLFVNVLSVCLISFVDLNTDIAFAIFLLTVIFIVYLVINFIAAKSTKIKPKLFIKFVVLVLAFNGFSLISKQTEFFGINRQVVDLKEVNKIVVSITGFDKVTDEWKEYKLRITDLEKDKEIVEEIQNLQLEASKRFKNEKNWDNDYYPIYEDNPLVDVEYYSSENEKRVRTYKFFLNDELDFILKRSEIISGDEIK